MRQAVFALTKRVDPTSDRRYALPDVEVQPLHKGSVDLTTTRHKHLFDLFQSTEYRAVLDTDDAPSPTFHRF